MSTSTGPATQPPAPAPAKAPELDDAGVAALSRTFMSDYDRRELAKFADHLGPGFVFASQRRFYDATRVTKQMESAIERKIPNRTRTCEGDQVHRASTAIVHIVYCTETVPPFGEAAAAIFEGYHTFVWTPVGTSWKLAHWQWQRAGLEAEREDWNEVYRSATHFKREPNQHLIDSVRGRKPGTALDIASGQGRNAVYLASQGWKVAGIDISDEGHRVAKAAAAKQKLKLETIQADVDKYDFGTNRWDLVTMIYAGDDEKLIEKLKVAIKPGGLFIAEFFHAEATSGTGIGGFKTGQLARVFADWTIITDVVVEDIADWGLRKTKVVRFTAQKKR